MIALLVVTHGQLAEELVRAAKRIVGPSARLHALSLGWDDDVSEARRRIEEAVAALDEGEGVMVLTDMFGGTPTNLASTFLRDGRMEIVTGVNLPMLIKFTNLRGETSLREVAARLARQGRESIQVASEFARRPEEGS